MTRQERATLARLAQSPTPVSEIPAEQIDKFVNYGLAVREALRCRITTKGQLELFRQRYRRMAMQRRVMASTEFLAKLDRHFHRRRPSVFFSLADEDEAAAKE